MKPLHLLALTTAFAAMSFTAPTQADKNSSYESSTVFNASVKWKKTEIDLGQIPQNKPVTIEYEFANTGDAPVIITSVQAGCGCTSTDYVKTPIAPGATTKISAVFNAAAKGAFKKSVTVITSADETPQVLTFTGTVI